MVADVTKAADVERVLDFMMWRHGRIDILVNNVGSTVTEDPVSLDEEVWEPDVP